MRHEALWAVIIALSTAGGSNQGSGGGCNEPVGEVVVEHDRFYAVQLPTAEGSSLVLCFRSPAGSASMRGAFAGELALLDGAERFVVVGLSSHYEVRQTLLFDLSGSKPKGRVFVYDCDGREILRQDYRTETSVRLEVAGTPYSIPLGAPDFPG